MLSQFTYSKFLNFKNIKYSEHPVLNSKTIKNCGDCRKCRTCNHWKSIGRLFHVLAQYQLTAGDLELDYYHQKVNVKINEDLGKLENFREILERLRIDNKSPDSHPKNKFWQLCWKIFQNLLQNIPKKHVLYLNMSICLQYFVHECLRKHISISKLANVSHGIYIFCKF